MRSASLWRQLHGDQAELTHVESTSPGTGSAAYPDPNRPYIRLEPRAKFFWDTRYPHLPNHPFHDSHINGAVYFTAFSGDDPDYHNVCVAIRKQGFDPRVTRERTQLADQRRNRLLGSAIIEKAKGVDIGLSVRVLEDAYHNIFSSCFLFTSDIDFLPVIRVLQRIGKKVLVFGYMDGLGSRSELEYVPDAFIDLSDHMRKNYVCKSPTPDRGTK